MKYLLRWFLSDGPHRPQIFFLYNKKKKVQRSTCTVHGLCWAQCRLHSSRSYVFFFHFETVLSLYPCRLVTSRWYAPTSSEQTYLSGSYLRYNLYFFVHVVSLQHFTGVLSQPNKTASGGRGRGGWWVGVQAVEGIWPCLCFCVLFLYKLCFFWLERRVAGLCRDHRRHKAHFSGRLLHCLLTWIKLSLSPCCKFAQRRDFGPRMHPLGVSPSSCFRLGTPILPSVSTHTFHLVFFTARALQWFKQAKEWLVYIVKSFVN